MRRNVLLIDNLDSFSFNLVEAFERQGAEVQVVRNSIAAAEALEMAQAREALIVLSPGPGAPQHAGCCIELVARAKSKVPLAGICLGHQAIVVEAGGTVARAPEPVHGRAWRITHQGGGALAGLPPVLTVGRYHSLTATDLPTRLTVDGVSEGDGLVMAVSDPEARQVGLQFHPESVLTPQGDRIIANLLALVRSS